MVTILPSAPSRPAWSLERGAVVVDGGVRFALWAPRVERVSVRLCGGDAAGTYPMARRDPASGVHEVLVPAACAGDDYQLVLDGEKVRPDPVSRWQPYGVHGASRVTDPSSFHWGDVGWTGRAMADLILYELHIGTFSDEGTFDGAIGHLESLSDLGVTAIEIMPVAEFPGARNWGYDGVSLYAPHSAYGGPDGLRRLVDAAHDAELAVILDVVYNHVGPEGNYLADFGPYFSKSYRTPWGDPVNYDSTDSDEVRRFVVDNALHWVTEFHLDGLRLDAVHAIYDFGAHHILQEIGEAVHAQGERLGRSIVVIAESDLNDPRLLRPPAHGGFGLDAQWSDDFHHSVHSLLTGERQGYYSDFAGVDGVAKLLEERFVYDGIHSSHRRRRHGAPARDVPADHFVVALQNHDQVGNRAAGDRLSTLLSPAQLRLAAALLLLSPYVPLLFMGEDYAETNPFLYFVSHGDAGLVEAVRRGRREEFASFGWAQDVPDPQDEDTFLRCKLNRGVLCDFEHAAIRRLYQDLLRLRRTERALRPGCADVTVRHDTSGWIALDLRPPSGHGRKLIALFNLSARPQAVPVRGGSVGIRDRIEVVLDTERPEYGNTRTPQTDISTDSSEADDIMLPPFSARLYRSLESR
ncbi:MAG: malto-oligosyltrehalose trehalohydrolase [Gemmatimonadaceae bacterium]